jgi:hypothetical protein
LTLYGSHSQFQLWTTQSIFEVYNVTFQFIVQLSKSLHKTKVVFSSKENAMINFICLLYNDVSTVGFCPIQCIVTFQICVANGISVVSNYKFDNRSTGLQIPSSVGV